MLSAVLYWLWNHGIGLILVGTGIAMIVHDFWVGDRASRVAMLERSHQELRGSVDALVQYLREREGYIRTLHSERDGLVQTIMAAAEAEDSDRLTPLRRPSLPPPRMPQPKPIEWPSGKIESLVPPGLEDTVSWTPAA